MRRSKSEDPVFVLGLGNPGPRFENSRHNVGYRVADLLMIEQQTQFRRRIFTPVRYAVLRPGEARRELVVLRWKGYMNSSGTAVQPLKRMRRFQPENLIAVADNMDLSPGLCRLKFGGGNAGHNGLKSIAANLGTESYWRLYIGVGRPQAGVSTVEHVLSSPGSADSEAIESACRRAADAIREAAFGDIRTVTQELNRREH